MAKLYAVPTIYEFRHFVVAGGSSATAPIRMTRIAKRKPVGRVLKGAKPAELPVLQSTKFDFVINLKTAKALGIEVPNSMQLLADEVIE